MLATDYTGLGVIITAVFAGIAACISAWNARSAKIIKANIDTNGDPRTLGQIASDVGGAVAPSIPPTPPTQEQP